MKDITQLSYFKDKDLTHAYDPLTGVLTRESIYDYLESLIKEKIPFSLIFSDLDFFKQINDSYGHQSGDSALRRVADAISNSFPEGVVGRFGGDEFILIMENIVEYEQVWNIARTVRSSVDNLVFTFAGKVDYSNIVTLTLGVSRFPLDGETLEEILEKADKALYRGKIKGRNCFVIYNHELHSKINMNSDENIISTELIVNFLFNEMTDKTKTIDDRVNKALFFIQDQFNIDRICLQIGDEVKYNCSPQRFDTVDVIPSHLYEKVIEDKDMTYVMNNRSHLGICSKEFFDEIYKNGIKSMYVCKCMSRNNKYGYLRIEMARERVWTRPEKATFMVLAKLYTMMLDFFDEEK